MSKVILLSPVNTQNQILFGVYQSIAYFTKKVSIIITTLYITSGFLRIKRCSILFGLIILTCLLPHAIVHGIEMDVKCTVYEHSDDENVITSMFAFLLWD